jgi:hypothetical protein
MPGHGPHERLAILERRKFVAQRYLRGESQWTIARALEVAQATVSNDLRAIQQDWLNSSLRDFDALKAQELAKVDEVERTAWVGWAKSQENTEILKAEMAGDKSRTSTVTKGQAGNPRFLDVVLKCIERRCAILGIDAEKRLKVTGLMAYAELSDAELNERIIAAQSRLALTVGGADSATGAGDIVDPVPRPPGPGPEQPG